MGYVNKDKQIVNVSRAEKDYVKRLRRRAEKRQLRGEHVGFAGRATRRGWWYA